MSENLIPCAVCGIPIVNDRHSKYCPECRKEVLKRQHRESAKRWYERQKQKNQDKKRPPIVWNDKWCKDCKYGLYLNDGTRHYVCDYLDQVGYMRPCKAGAECTVREKRKG